MIQELTLLIFRVDNIRFGVWAEHVEEIREEPPREGGRPGDAADVMVYNGQTIEVIDLARQLTNECAPQESLIYSKIPHLQAAAEPPDQAAPSDMAAPKILIMQAHPQQWLGVRIKNPEALVTVSLRQIHALPELMRRISRNKTVWGIALLHDEPAILVNPAQLLLSRSCHERHARPAP